MYMYMYTYTYDTYDVASARMFNNRDVHGDRVLLITQGLETHVTCKHFIKSVIAYGLLRYENLDTK